MMLCLSSVFLALFILFINLSPSMPSLLARQTPQQYYLRTAVYTSNGTNDTGTLKENLYVQAYHVGAGFNDVVLKPNISDSVPGYLNSTIDPVSGETTKITSLPPIVVNGEEIYWEMCAISANDSEYVLASVSQRRLAPWEERIPCKMIKANLNPPQTGEPCKSTSGR